MKSRKRTERDGDSEYQCRICFERYGLNEKRTPKINRCGHDFCAGCIAKIKTCSVCQTPITPSPYITVFSLIPPDAKLDLNEELNDLKAEISFLPQIDKQQFARANSARAVGEINCAINDILTQFAPYMNTEMFNIDDNQSDVVLKSDTRRLLECVDHALKKVDGNDKSNIIQNLNRAIRHRKANCPAYLYLKSGELSSTSLVNVNTKTNLNNIIRVIAKNIIIPASREKKAVAIFGKLSQLALSLENE